jgi:hypothetical protein
LLDLHYRVGTNEISSNHVVQLGREHALNVVLAVGQDNL